MIQAASYLTPSTNLTPQITPPISSLPLNLRQCFPAHRASSKTIVKQAVRLPHRLRRIEKMAQM